VQQVLARKLLAYRNLAARIKSNQMKYCLAEINADRVQLSWNATSVILISKL
jgi:hypothetical protein